MAVFWGAEHPKPWEYPSLLLLWRSKGAEPFEKVKPCLCLESFTNAVREGYFPQMKQRSSGFFDPVKHLAHLGRQFGPVPSGD